MMGSNGKAVFAAGAVFLALVAAVSALPGVQMNMFCAPAAHLGAGFLGVPASRHPQGYVLAQPGLPVLVTVSCSAAGFFALTTALLVGLLAERAHTRRWHYVLTVPAAYILTVVANTARIVTGSLAARAYRPFLPEGFWPGAHMGVGMLVFLSFFVLTYVLVRRGAFHERAE